MLRRHGCLLAATPLSPKRLLQQTCPERSQPNGRVQAILASLRAAATNWEAGHNAWHASHKVSESAAGHSRSGNGQPL